MKKLEKAFTLAEILIAVAVIGIAAALTIPTFIDNTKGHANRNKFMKIQTDLVHAATASYGLNGYDFSGANGYYGTQNHPISVSDTPGGAADGSVIGAETKSINNTGTYSDMYPYTDSLFHIFHDHLLLANSKEVVNYAVMPVEIGLSCAGRVDVDEINVDIPGRGVVALTPIQKVFLHRESYDYDIIQGSGGLASLCNGRSVAEGGINQGRMFKMANGSVFTYDPAQAYCSEHNPCYGYIDINGPEGPNRMVACSEGVDSYITTYSEKAGLGTLQGSCTVNGRDTTDIYPVLFYNQVMKPASWAARSVYFKLKTNQKAVE